MNTTRFYDCDVCGLQIMSDYHSYRETDCPNFVVFDETNDEDFPDYGCDCDLHAHPECCPQCN